MRPKENIWNVPNVLTMLRMALIGVFVGLFAVGYYGWSAAVFVLAGLTDMLDGYIARKRQLVTSFGKLMDPLADKLMLVAALSCLVSRGLVPIWVLLTVVVKELVMVVGGVLLLRRGIVVQAVSIGKVATICFSVAVVATFLHDYLAPWDFVLQCAAVVLSLSALVWYVVNAIQKVNNK